MQPLCGVSRAAYRNGRFLSPPPWSILAGHARPAAEQHPPPEVGKAALVKQKREQRRAGLRGSRASYQKRRVLQQLPKAGRLGVVPSQLCLSKQGRIWGDGLQVVDPAQQMLLQEFSLARGAAYKEYAGLGAP